MSRRRRPDYHDHDGEPYGDLLAWITAYLSGDENEDDGGDRRGRAGRGRRGRAACPDDLPEHLAGLREQIHGASARQYGRGRGRGRPWQRAADEDAAPEQEVRSGHARAVAWMVLIRVAVIAIAAVVARGRARRHSRPRRGFRV